MFETCYLHIGTEKTGTTSIQSFLSDNRNSLRAQGYLYPGSFGLPNQIGLAVYAASPDMLGPLMHASGVRRPQDLPQRREKLARDFRAEVARSPDARILVLSNEHLHSRVRTRAEAQALASLLSPVCREIKIIVYLRRQDLVATSLASTLFKAGRTTPWEPPATSGRTLPPYYDYGALLDNYAGVFGAENCVPRLFEAGRFQGGDLISDFAAAIGLPLSFDFERPKEENKSITLLGQAVLAQLNRHMPPFIDGKRNPLRGNIDEVVGRRYAGKPVLMSRAQAMEFYRAFAESNAAVKSRYFPDLDRETLFEEDFDAYPEQPPSQSFTFEQGCEAAALLWLDRMRVMQAQARRLAGLKETKAQLQADLETLAALGNGSSDAGSPEVLAAISRVRHVLEGGAAQVATPARTRA